MPWPVVGLSNKAFLGSDTKEKINFLKKKDFHKLHEYIDEDQLLEEYGGKLKLPAKIWPPVDIYSPEDRQNMEPVLEPETETNKYDYSPGVNEALRVHHSLNPAESNKNEGFYKNLDFQFDSNRQIGYDNTGPVGVHSANHVNQITLRDEVNEREKLKPSRINGLEVIPEATQSVEMSPANVYSSLDRPNLKAIPETDVKVVIKTETSKPPSDSSTKTSKKCQCSLI